MSKKDTDMWFFKGFAQGIGILFIVVAVIATMTLIIISPFFVFQELFGDVNGVYIALVFDMIMGAGLMGAWAAYECRSDE